MPPYARIAADVDDEEEAALRAIVRPDDVDGDCAMAEAWEGMASAVAPRERETTQEICVSAAEERPLPSETPARQERGGMGEREGAALQTREGGEGTRARAWRPQAATRVRCVPVGCTARAVELAGPGDIAIAGSARHPSRAMPGRWPPWVRFFS